MLVVVGVQINKINNVTSSLSLQHNGDMPMLSWGEGNKVYI